MESLIRSTSQGTRWMARRPVSSLVSAIALAVGITTCALAWTLLDAAVLNPFGVPDSDELVVMWETDAARREQLIEISLLDFADWQREARTVTSLAAFGSSHWPSLARIGEDTLPLAIRGVSTSFFRTLGIAPMLGRGFADSDLQASVVAPVVLSHRLWQSRFAAARDVVGRSLFIDGTDHTIIGVMPSGFAFPDDPDVWVSVERVLAQAFASMPEPQQRQVGVLEALGRRHRASSNDDVQRELTAIAGRIWDQHHHEPRQSVVVVTPFADVIMGRLGGRLWIALGMAIAVFLLACANVAAVRVAHLRERGTELAARLFLGATRRRVAGELALEALPLAVAASLLTPLLWIAIVALLSDASVVAESGVNLVDHWTGALLSMAGLASVAWVLTGVMPALLSWRSSLADAGLAARRTALRASRVGVPLLFAQAALAVIVVAVAAAAIQAFSQLARLDIGFATRHVTLIDIAVPEWRYPEPPERRQVVERLQREISGMAGVRLTAAVSIRPFRFGEVVDGYPVRRAGDTLVDVSAATSGSRVVTTPEYFAAIGQPVVEGRSFSVFDRADSPRVAIISRTLAAVLWGDQPALGKYIETYSLTEKWTPRLVIGVAGDARYRSLVRPSLEVFIPHTQASMDLGSLVVSTEREGTLTAAMLRDVLRRVDPEIALEQVQGTSELVATILSPARLVATIVGLLGTAGLVLLALGVFGATAAALRAATTEIAIRQALGATSIQAARAPLMMFARALMLGLGVGLPMAPLALSAARALGIDGSATIMTMAAAALAVCGAALVASGPALWRAARQSPADLLRQA